MNERKWVVGGGVLRSALKILLCYHAGVPGSQSWLYRINDPLTLNIFPVLEICISCFNILKVAIQWAAFELVRMRRVR